jgi:hypothetical protein
MFRLWKEEITDEKGVRKIFLHGEVVESDER